MIQGRALHFVIRVSDRRATVNFYRDILGMKVLRHEEFKEGCAAACNGKYNNRWSKTMVGYGPEDTHFVVELTYNYTVRDYTLGNDFLGVTIRSREALARAQEANLPIVKEEGKHILKDPLGFPIILLDEPQPDKSDPVCKVALAVSNLQRSIEYWNGLLKMEILNKTEGSAELTYSTNQTTLELKHTGPSIDCGTAGVRIAFAIPFDQQPAVDEAIQKAGQTILTPLVSLDTPGKAAVRVIILADPDGHEICFVDEEGFKELSQVDPEADELVEKYIRLDKSDQFLEK